MRFALRPDPRIEPEISERKRAESARFESFHNFVLLLLLISISGCIQKPAVPVSHLERVKQSGELRVVTRYGPATYYESVNGPAGLEHDLAQLFAKRLNVKVKFLVRDSPAQVSRLIADGQADIAAAGLIVSDAQNKRLRFASPYRRITEQVLYNRDRPSPSDIADLRGLVEIPAGSAHAATLKQLKRRHAGLHWRVNFDHNVNDLLYLTSEGLVDYTVAHSDQALIMRRFYPKLKVAFDIGKPRELAWALPMAEDNSLYDEVARFFEDIKRDKTLDQLIDRYYGHAAAFDPALDSALRRDYRTRLPRFKPLFVEAASRHNIDWRLLAAISYQESKWKSTAVSAEGVRGMMMLTGVTARELKVRDRFDAAQSIWGGASYLRQTLATIPPHIQDPDRTWYALAAYNLGYGHVEDARGLVRENGGDPDKWIEIKKVLPLLGQEDWYRRTKHGRARGRVAVHYVNSIRRYYDLLVWLTEAEENRQMAQGFAWKADGA
jgi:membrane-bound lytic murein transglycosylase F